MSHLRKKDWIGPGDNPGFDDPEDRKDFDIVAIAEAEIKARISENASELKQGFISARTRGIVAQKRIQRLTDTTENVEIIATLTAEKIAAQAESASFIAQAVANIEIEEKKKIKMIEDAIINAAKQKILYETESKKAVDLIFKTKIKKNLLPTETEKKLAEAESKKAIDIMINAEIRKAFAKITLQKESEKLKEINFDYCDSHHAVKNNTMRNLNTAEVPCMLSAVIEEKQLHQLKIHNPVLWAVLLEEFDDLQNRKGAIFKEIKELKSCTNRVIIHYLSQKTDFEKIYNISLLSKERTREILRTEMKKALDLIESQTKIIVAIIGGIAKREFQRWRKYEGCLKKFPELHSWAYETIADAVDKKTNLYHRSNDIINDLLAEPMEEKCQEKWIKKRFLQQLTTSLHLISEEKRQEEEKLILSTMLRLTEQRQKLEERKEGRSSAAAAATFPSSPPAKMFDRPRRIKKSPAKTAAVVAPLDFKEKIQSILSTTRRQIDDFFAIKNSIHDELKQIWDSPSPKFIEWREIFETSMVWANELIRYQEVFEKSDKDKTAEEKYLDQCNVLANTIQRYHHTLASLVSNIREETDKIGKKESPRIKIKSRPEEKGRPLLLTHLTAAREFAAVAAEAAARPATAEIPVTPVERVPSKLSFSHLHIAKQMATHASLMRTRSSITVAYQGDITHLSPDSIRSIIDSLRKLIKMEVKDSDDKKEDMLRDKIINYAIRFNLMKLAMENRKISQKIGTSEEKEREKEIRNKYVHRIYTLPTSTITRIVLDVINFIPGKLDWNEECDILFKIHKHIKATLPETFVFDFQSWLTDIETIDELPHKTDVEKHAIFFLLICCAEVVWEFLKLPLSKHHLKSQHKEIAASLKNFRNALAHPEVTTPEQAEALYGPARATIPKLQSFSQLISSCPTLGTNPEKKMGSRKMR